MTTPDDTLAAEDHEIRVEYMRLDELHPDPRNPKNHSLPDIDASMDRFGYTEPVLLDERTGLLVAGHGRVESAQGRKARGEAPPRGVKIDPDGAWLLPVARGWSSVDDTDAGAYLVASNRLTEKGGWLDDPLGQLLTGLRAEDRLAGTGYDGSDVDALLASLATVHVDEHERAPAEPREPADVQQRVAPGDVWALGPHRLMCGDSRNPEHVGTLLDGAVVNVAFTSPPYADRRTYDASSGFRPIPPDEYVEWFAPVAANVAAHLAPDGSWFVNIKPGVTPDGDGSELYVFDLVLAHARQWGWNLATEFCWERNGVPKAVSRRFKNQFEPVYQFARGRWKMRPDAVRHASDNVPIPFGPGAGQTSWDGRGSDVDPQGTAGGAMFGAKKRRGGTREMMSDVQGTSTAPGEWIAPGMAYPGNRLPTFAGSHEATGHAAAYPVGLPAWFLRAYSDVGDTVYDPFVGSGSTILAAEQEQRIGFGMEISPGYCDVILDRWERHGGTTPVKAEQ